MGAITNKCFDLLESAGNYEERRSTGILISSNWFDAIDGCGTTERDREGSKLAQLALKGIEAAKLWQPINEIP